LRHALRMIAASDRVVPLWNVVQSDQCVALKETLGDRTECSHDLGRRFGFAPRRLAHQRCARTVDVEPQAVAPQRLDQSRVGCLGRQVPVGDRDRKWCDFNAGLEEGVVGDPREFEFGGDKIANLVVEDQCQLEFGRLGRGCKLRRIGPMWWIARAIRVFGFPGKLSVRDGQRNGVVLERTLNHRVRGILETGRNAWRCLRCRKLQQTRCLRGRARGDHDLCGGEGSRAKSLVNRGS